MIFVDTNYFLRFLLSGVGSQHREARKLFDDAADGKIKLFSSTIVFFEIYWLLKSLYEKSQDEIYPILEDILDLGFIKFYEFDVLKNALQIYKNTNLGLEDSYNLVYSKYNNATEFKTFDKALIKNLSKFQPWNSQK